MNCPSFLLFSTVACMIGCDARRATESSASATAPATSQAVEKATLLTDWPLTREEAQRQQSEQAAEAGLPIFFHLTIRDSVGLEFAFIPHGVFPMGSETVRTNPPRLIRISHPFMMSRHEITIQQFSEVVDPAKVSRLTRLYLEDVTTRPDTWQHPARVSWIAATKFCEELSGRFGLTARLPSEAEWEYAARAGTIGKYGEWDKLEDVQANLRSRRPREGNIGSVEVGQYEPNPWRLFDMIGNMEEWCLDAYSYDSDLRNLPSVDPVLVRKWSLFRVLRGDYYNGTVYDRNGDATSNPRGGIRVVIEIDDALRTKLAELKE